MLSDQTQRNETNPNTNLQTKHQPATTNQPPTYQPPTNHLPSKLHPPTNLHLPPNLHQPTHLHLPPKSKPLILHQTSKPTRRQTLRYPEQRKDRDPPSTKMVRGHSPETETQIELSRKPDTVLSAVNSLKQDNGKIRPGFVFSSRMWRERGENMEKRWRECGEMIERRWRNDREKMERMRRKCGENVEKIWRECGEKLERIGASTAATERRRSTEFHARNHILQCAGYTAPMGL